MLPFFSPRRYALSEWTKNEPAPFGTGSNCLRPNLLLLHSYADIVHIHVGEVSVAVLVIVEVDTNRLTFVRGQVIGDLRPGLSVGADLDDLRQRGAGGVLHLGLLPVVGDGVGCGGPVPEGEGRLGCGTGNGDGLVEEVIAIRFTAGTCAVQRAISSRVFLHRADGWRHHAAGGPVGQSAGFKSAILDQLTRWSGHRQGDGGRLDERAGGSGHGHIGGASGGRGGRGEG